MLVPAWLTDTVTLWARSRGRTAKVFWNPVMQCYGIWLRALPDDPKWRAYLDGELRREPGETIMLVEPGEDTHGLQPIDLKELGASGLREHLDAADLMTGRGEFASLFDALKAHRRAHQQLRAERRAEAGESGRELAWLHGKQILGIPQVTVEKEINDATVEPGRAAEAAPEEAAAHHHAGSPAPRQ